MRKAVRRLVAATGVLVAGAALPLVVTAPAHATTDQCMGYLASKGYIAGPKVRAACALNDPWSAPGFGACQLKLVQIHVKQEHAATACQWAAD